ncbi:hypothetical protein [Paracoccus methylarcula]|uniref:hypothetical protein n=1 Tax=Paracoccus methylarcula TaxID=72022 RepID=UPI001B861E26|nr:hypothetical protein [Paracoccus methylarcula]
MRSGADLGRLRAGGPADIAVFALNGAIMTPAIDPITTLVAGGSGKVTRAVFVDGRLSMRRIAGQAEVAGLDLLDAQTRAQAQFDGLVAKYPERSWQHPPLSELFPPSYPLESS